MKIWAPLVLTVSLLALGFGMAHAQTKGGPASATPPSASPDYPAEPYVFDRLSHIYRYAADGTGSREYSGVVEIRNEAGVKAFGILPFDFASSSEHVEIDYLRVRHADGSIISTSAADAQELPAQVTRDAPFYSDIKEEQIPVRSLQPGDRIEYSIRIVRTKPEAPGHFWGNDSFFLPSSGIVIRSEVIELHLPQSASVQVWSPNYKPTITDASVNGIAERSYRWHSSQLASTAGKPKNDLLELDNDPALGTSDAPKLPHVAWTNFHSWQEVGAWYRSLEGARTQADDDIRAKVSTLIAGKSTEDEKAQAIYAYVSAQARYIGVAFGIGRFQPHAAGDVLSNQYGDCKDKSTLLISMLSAAGISADAVLIGAGIAFNPAVPSPGSFNHIITLAHVDNKPAWLDSTAEVAPYRLLSAVLRGKQSLVIPITGNSHLETTPKDPPFPFEDRFQAIGALDENGTAHSHITIDVRGDDEVPFRQAVRTVSPAQWDELMQRISYAMGYSGKVTNTQFSRPDDTTIPFHIAYDYEREKNGDWDNLRILPQFSSLALADADPKDPPVTPIELGTPALQVSHSVMTLPKGWSANLPPSIHAHAPFATLDKTYKFENATLTTDRRVEVLKPNIPASDWQAYHQWFKDAGLEGESYIQLIPAKANGAFFPLPIPTEDNPEANELIRQVVQAELRNDWNGARSLLDKARALNDKQAFLWSNYGYLAMTDHHPSDAIADLRKELSLHPGEGFVSRLLASYYMVQKEPDQAIATLQAAITRNPTDESTVLYLASIYTQRDDNPSAEKTLRSALAAAPSSLPFKMQLGITLLHEQKNSEGETLLRDVVATSTDPLQLNNGAYELANSSLDLPLAETTSDRSLALLDQASNNGETGPNALRRASLIVSAWDTYGWILYREGKVTEAEPWIRAAWRNDNSAETGYHLAVLLEKEGHPDQALHQLELAKVGDRGADAAAVQKLIADESTKLIKSSTLSATANPRAELQNQRTYKLPRGTLKPTDKGWATIELEVTAQATTAFRIVDGDQSLAPLADAVQHLNLDLHIPPASHATLVRHGVLSCDTTLTCQLVLVSASSVN